ncbi:hypothetical protein A3F29_02310 [Candidatus Roizmanbacteria bacterium RIFCSPHIGHO2_12_FULL_33_9]|uniref:Uncharacterized protein n=1 Tax=Candidatus Roizmanbacteria bacterium RIFCSPHIGHO2_12_FULL_33_9 TaxID=1802045 RepID=A0A1F7HI53_9BACT|nr:MAG: hypothetical protein A3F29_02310 [Candidatus Roizmanbacteria bacterium RIFCSPHIGHO2_12_FULL_33_9]
MPRKTKKQKIQAQLRQKDFLLNLEKKGEKPTDIQVKLKKKSLIQPDTTVYTKKAAPVTSYFKKDFVKSIIIISIIIALEIVIYFGTINKYF